MEVWFDLWFFIDREIETPQLTLLFMLYRYKILYSCICLWVSCIEDAEREKEGNDVKFQTPFNHPFFFFQVWEKGREIMRGFFGKGLLMGLDRTLVKLHPSFGGNGEWRKIQ